MSMKKHLRHVLLWIYDKNNQIKGDDAVEEIREVYGHDSIGRMTVFRWLKKFRNGDKNVDDLEDDPRSGRPSKFNEKSHPRLKLFIVHGGYNSLLESAINGVPVIVIPMFADQFRNAKNAEYRGFGYYLDRLDFNKGSLKRALTEVLSNPSYKNSAVRLSQLIKDKPFKPKETFLKWVRFVANHGILPELEPEGARMNFLRYFCLDVFFGISIFISLALYVFYKILSISMRSFIRFFTFSKIKLD